MYSDYSHKDKINNTWKYKEALWNLRPIHLKLTTKMNKIKDEQNLMILKEESFL